MLISSKTGGRPLGLSNGRARPRGLQKLLFLDQLYTGWNDRTIAIGLNCDYINTNDLSQLEADIVTVAPNPIQDVMKHFDFDVIADEVNVHLLDVTGKLLGTYQYDNLLEGDVEINTEHLAAGTYFLSVETTDGYLSKKVIKQ